MRMCDLPGVFCSDEALETYGRAMVLYPLWSQPFFGVGKALWMQ